MGRIVNQPRNQILAQASWKSLAGGNNNMGPTQGNSINIRFLDRRDINKSNFGPSVSLDKNSFQRAGKVEDGKIANFSVSGIEIDDKNAN